MIRKFLILSLITVFLTGCWEIDKGEKTGKIVKISKGGYFIKTWDGELIRGGFNDGSGSNDSSFYFAVEDNDLAVKLREAMEKQKQVNIKYHQEFFTFFRTNNHADYFFYDYFVDDVVIL